MKKRVFHLKATRDEMFYLLFGVCEQIGGSSDESTNRLLCGMRQRIVAQLEAGGTAVPEKAASCYWVNIGSWNFPRGFDLPRNEVEDLF